MDIIICKRKKAVLIWFHVAVDVAYIFTGCADGSVGLTKLTLDVQTNDDIETVMQAASIETIDTWFKNHKTIVNLIGIHDDVVSMNAYAMLICAFLN